MAWQLTSQLKVPGVTEHSPLQLALHWAMQSGGCPVQLPLQRAPQLALHWAVQSLMQFASLLDVHCDMHTPLQFP